MSPRQGFTLIELLITLVVIAILVTVAIPHFSNTTAKASDAAAISDLRNAMSAQEAYLYDNQTYTLLANLAVTTSTGVALGGSGTSGGYLLTARHQASNAVWEVSVGSGGSTEGRITKQ